MTTICLVTCRLAAESVGALPGHEHLEMGLLGLDRGGEAGLLTLGESLLGAAQQRS